MELEDNWLSQLCELARKWRAAGFTHIFVRQTDKGTECCVFPAMAGLLAEEERFGCLLVIPLDNSVPDEFTETVSVLAGVSDRMWIFDGRRFVRPAELH